jgi:hypothetical protein
MVLSLDTTASNVALSGSKKIDSYQGKYSCSKYFTASIKSGVENICDRKGEAAREILIYSSSPHKRGSSAFV